MSSHRERGSALIEAVVIGSVVFLIVMGSIGASMRIAVRGAAAGEAARAGAVHAARHDDVDAADEMARTLFPGFDVSARREGDSIVVVAGSLLPLPHPDGTIGRYLITRAEMPLAPFRSDRG